MGWLMNGIFSSGITLGFVGFILFVFAFSLVFYIITVTNALRNLKSDIERVKDIQNNNGDILPDSLDEFKKISDSGNCRYFSRILMEYNNKLYTTQDVASTVRELWTPEIMQSRIVPVVSAILTGLGVLGTFVGLVSGLTGLQLDGNTENIQEQIQRVAHGASFAFITSIFGVFLSLIFTVIEKRFSGRIIKTIKDLERLLSSAFPPFPIMNEVFVETLKETRESRNILGNLAEQIGERMQKALDGFSQNIANRIVGELGPVIDRLANTAQDLADRQAASSTEVLEGLLKTFTDKMGAEGTAQRTALNAITQQFNTSVGNFTTGINDAIENISTTTSTLSDTMDGFIGKLDERSISINDIVNEILDRLSSSIHAMQNILNQGESLQDRIESGRTLLNNLAQSVNDANRRLGDFELCITRSAESINLATETVREIGGIQVETAESFRNVIEGLNNVRQGLDQVRGGFENVSQILRHSVQEVQEGFNSLSTHYTGLQERLREHITELEQQTQERITNLDDHMGTLLTRYSELVGVQIQNRMSEWDQQTRDFCDRMTATVQAMQEIIDEIENHTNHNR